MTGPHEMRLHDVYDEPRDAVVEPAALSQELPSGAGSVRADLGGNIVDVRLDSARLRLLNPAVLTAQLTEAIQHVQRRAADLRRQTIGPRPRRR